MKNYFKNFTFIKGIYMAALLVISFIVYTVVARGVKRAKLAEQIRSGQLAQWKKTIEDDAAERGESFDVALERHMEYVYPRNPFKPAKR